MGWFKSKNGIIGDTPLDIFGDAIEAVKKSYRAEILNRDPSLLEIRDAFNYVMAPLEKKK